MIKNEKKLNLKTKIFLFLFFSFIGLYLLNKFFDSYRLTSPIEIKIKSPIERRGASMEIPKKEKHARKGQNLSKFNTSKNASEDFKNNSLLIDNTHPKDAIYIYFGDDKIAYAIAKAESGLNPKAVGDNGCSIGIFQINSCVHKKYDRERLFEPLYNAKAAYEIYKSWGGWHAWSTYINKSYLKFL